MITKYNWYSELIKPSWAPPSWLFGPVWTVLYIIIAITFTIVLYNVATKRIPFIIGLPFVLNLIFNFAFTPIQFGLRNNFLASIDIILILFTLIWAIITVYKYLPIISFLQIPYLLWVLFATVLQINITILNK